MALAKFTLFFIFFLAVSLKSEKLKIEALDQINAIPTSNFTTSGFLSVVDDSIHDNMADSPHLLQKDMMGSKARKLLLEGDEIMEPDYDYAGPNPKHDPKKGKGGGRAL